jgi:hypothetical protein
VLLMLDFYCSHIMIIIYYMASKRHIFCIYEGPCDYLTSSKAQLLTTLILISLCGGYQFLRGLLRLSNANVQILDKCLNMINSFIIFFSMGMVLSSTKFTSESLFKQKEIFRIGTSLCIGWLFLEAWIVWTKACLKFAVTSNGAKYVLMQISYFIFVLLFVILLFSSMFTLVYSSTNICENPEDFPFCMFGTAMIQLYNYFYGGIDYAFFFALSNGVELDPTREGNVALGL